MSKVTFFKNDKKTYTVKRIVGRISKVRCSSVSCGDWVGVWLTSRFDLETFH